VFFLLLAGLMLSHREQNGREIVRPLPGETSFTRGILLEGEEGELEIALEIGAREYTEEEIEKLHKEAERYLLQVLPGANEGLDRITERLYFPNVLPATGESIYWRTDKPWLISQEGEVQNEELEEPEQAEVTAEISYGTEFRHFRYVVTVFPRQYTAEEQRIREIKKELKELEEGSRSREVFELPEMLSGLKLVVKEESSFGKEAYFILLAVTIPLLVYSGYFSSLESRQNKRRQQAESGYMEFVTKLSLLMAAGVSVRQAFYRLEAEYEKNYGEEHVITMELKVTKQELENGYSEGAVYEAFGRRMGLLTYQRMSSLLVQNAAKGIQGIRDLLLQEAGEALAQERATIKIRGEEAETKLLFPMMGLLLLVFAILLVPAFQSF